MRRSLRLGCLVASLLGTIGCESRARARRVDSAVYAWAQCTDCMHRQLETVVTLGDTAVPRLERVLIEGPPVAHDSAYLVTLQRAAGGPGVPASPGVAVHQRMFRHTYRRRALIALTEIGTQRAGTALCLALTSAQSAADTIAIDSGLVRIGRTCP